MTNKSVLDKFIDNIVEQTAGLYKGFLEEYPEKKAIFRDNFEDLLLFHIVTIYGTNRVGIGRYDRNEKVSKCIAVALETIGISVNSASLLYDDDYFDINLNSICDVKWRIVHNERKYLGMDIGDYVSSLKESDRYMNDTGALLELAFAVSDRESNYNEERHQGSFRTELVLMWQQKKATMDEDSFSYKVLKNVIEEDSLHHYSLVERRALISACSYMEKLESGGSLSLREFFDMKNAFRLASKVDPVKMGFFEELYGKALTKFNAKHSTGISMSLKQK